MYLLEQRKEIHAPLTVIIDNRAGQLDCLRDSPFRVKKRKETLDLAKNANRSIIAHMLEFGSKKQFVHGLPDAVFPPVIVKSD